MFEAWKDVEGYEGLYKVSNLGNVMSLRYRRGHFSKTLIPKCNSCGRLWVELSRDGVTKPMQIHRLVAIAFLPNPENYPEINHKDENPQNNRVDNLEWCTRQYNVNYYFDRRRNDSIKRNGKLKESPIIQKTLDGEFVRMWDNSRQIKKELNLSDWSVSECCRGNRKTAYGFTWHYAI